MYAAYQLTGPRSDVALWLLVIGLAVVYLGAKERLTLQTCLRRIFPIVLIGFLIIGIRTIRSTPDPDIDVFLVQQAAAKAMVSFQNPYTATIPDIYGPSSPYYYPMVENGRTTYGFPYPPLVAFLELPGFLLTHDIRYTHVFALLLSSCLIAFIRPSWLSLCGAILLLVHPFSLMLVQYAWTEPSAILFFSLTLFCALRYSKALPYVLGLFLATKQPMLAIVALAPLLARDPWDWKTIITDGLKSLAVVCALYLPFFVWNRQAFVASLITVQLCAPTRTDLISYPAYFVKEGWFVLPAWLPFLYLPVGIYLGLRRAPRSPAGFAAAAALLLIPFFALSRHGAPNYYFLELAMLCGALAVATPATGTNQSLSGL